MFRDYSSWSTAISEEATTMQWTRISPTNHSARVHRKMVTHHTQLVGKEVVTVEDTDERDKRSRNLEGRQTCAGEGKVQDGDRGGIVP